MRRNVIDRMALLCTLHADGPRTLRLLREAGCTTIEKLGQLRPEKVGELLGLPPAAARRLSKEATRLLERLEPDLEQEEVTFPPAARASAVKPPPQGFRLEEVPTAFEESPTRQRADLDLRDRALLDRVVERWREEDAGKRRTVAAEEEEMLRQVEIQHGAVRAVEPEVVEALTAATPLSTTPADGVDGRPGGDRLRASDLPGLDPEACEALERGGVRSLEDLATCPIDELVTRTGLAFTRSRTLQFLAGKVLAERPEPAPAKPRERPEERISPRERPAFLEPAGGAWSAPLDDGGAAGPFA